MKEISDKEMKEMHDLVTNIQHHYVMMDRDMRNLYNLIHCIEGSGIRSPEFREE